MNCVSDHIFLPQLPVSILSRSSLKAFRMEGYIAGAAVIHPAPRIHLCLTLVAVEIARTVESGVVRQQQRVVLVPSTAADRRRQQSASNVHDEITWAAAAAPVTIIIVYV